MLSTKSKKIKNIIRSSDSRGSILSIVDEKVTNVSIITCLPKTIRSNHSHKKDWHYMYVLEGVMEYFFVSKNKTFFMKINKGENVFTPPKELHATYFPVKTVLLVSSKNPRDKKTYEQDTVREKLIDLKNYKSIKKSAKRIK
jgi:quercetin dioxygenase-like cupin family protein|tara:strand:+ start:1374 stop:1799 length:426 start_codon:yes stop_codon:yes gene_type:complete